MAVPFGFGIGDFVSAISLAITIAKKIQNAPDIVKAVIRDLEKLKFYMLQLEGYVEKNIPDLKQSMKGRLEDILCEIERDVTEIEGIVRAWNGKEGPYGIKLRSEHVHRAAWAVGSTPKRLQELLVNIETQKREVALLMLFVTQDSIRGLAEKPPVQAMIKKPHKSQYNIVFIDPYNEGRSVIAQAYTQLLRNRTLREHGKWPVNWNQSAGFLVKRQSETIAIQESIGMKLVNGGEKALATPATCLFEDTPFQSAFKDELWKRTLEHGSRGLTENVFTQYDFVLVFNKQHAKQLEALRAAFAAENMAKAGMGKLRFLGSYGETGNPEIWNPWTRSGEVSTSRAAWEPAVWNIKTSVEGFLRMECGWERPDQGAELG
jgi:hypothetical protein